jgi:cupin fold WbuC family metalloprotein
MTIDKELLDNLFSQASENSRLRINYDLRTSGEDTSQRMLNAMQPGTVCAIHRHADTSETVICLSGRMDEIFYEEVSEFQKASECSNDARLQDSQDVARRRRFKEIERIHLCPAEGKYGCQVPKGMWHTVEVIEPSVIFEAKDKAYGEDGSEIAE